MIRLLPHCSLGVRSRVEAAAIIACGILVSPASEPRVQPTGLGATYEVSPIEQGWQPSTVTSLIQAGSGYLWLGTYNGLLRYDGVRFTLYDSGNTEGLQNSRVTSLFEDQQVLWIGHETSEVPLRKYAPASYD